MPVMPMSATALWVIRPEHWLSLRPLPVKVAEAAVLDRQAITVLRRDERLVTFRRIARAFED